MGRGFALSGATTLTISDTVTNLLINSGGTINFASSDVVITHSSNNLAFTGGTHYTFDDAVIVGYTTGITAGSAADFQVLGTGPADSTALLGAWSADAVGPELAFVKSRAAALVTNTIVNDNDVVGRVVWYPADGVDFATEAAVFQAEVDDASPAAGDVGMAFVWRSMPGGAGAIADVMRLSAAGNLTPGVDDAGALGTTSLKWSDLHLGSGGVINWNSGTTTLTESGGALTASGALTAGGTLTSSAAGTSHGLTLTSTGGAQSPPIRLTSTAGTRYIDQSAGTVRFIDTTGGNVRMTLSDAGVLTVADAALVIPGSNASPASGGAGTAGQIAWDSSYLYVCVASNTWGRIALTGGY